MAAGVEFACALRRGIRAEGQEVLGLGWLLGEPEELQVPEP